MKSAPDLLKFRLIVSVSRHGIVMSSQKPCRVRSQRPLPRHCDEIGDRILSCSHKDGGEIRNAALLMTGREAGWRASPSIVPRGRMAAGSAARSGPFRAKSRTRLPSSHRNRRIAGMIARGAATNRWLTRDESVPSPPIRPFWALRAWRYRPAPGGRRRRNLATCRTDGRPDGGCTAGRAVPESAR